MKSCFFQKDGTTDKSPLQMLAQTCSQIGADSGPKMAGTKSAIISIISIIVMVD